MGICRIAGYVHLHICCLQFRHLTIVCGYTALYGIPVQLTEIIAIAVSDTLGRGEPKVLSELIDDFSIVV